MNASTKYVVMMGLAIGGCVADDASGDHASQDPDGPATASTDQAVTTQTIYDVRGFGGNLFAETFNYATGSSCSAWYQRRETPTTRWTAQVGGSCNFVGWLTPSNPFDCRALVVAHTAGGGFGGTCETFVTEEVAGNSYTFATGNTTSAQLNTVNRGIGLAAGQTLTIGTCGVTGASYTGDTYLRLLGPSGGEVAASDDACGGYGSQIVITAPAAGTYQIDVGCYASTSCNGTVAWTIQ